MGDWTQVIAIIGTLGTLIIALGGLSLTLHRSINKRIDDLAGDIRDIRKDIRLIVNKLIPNRKSKK